MGSIGLYRSYAALLAAALVPIWAGSFASLTASSSSSSLGSPRLTPFCLCKQLPPGLRRRLKELQAEKRKKEGIEAVDDGEEDDEEEEPPEKLSVSQTTAAIRLSRRYTSLTRMLH